MDCRLGCILAKQTEGKEMITRKPDWRDVNAMITQQRIAAWRAYYAAIRAMRALKKAAKDSGVKE